jgi:thiamine-phosphate pyrophosphorylase
MVVGSLILITPPDMPVEKMVRKVRQALRGGVDTVQLRRRNLSGKDFYTLALRLRKMTRNKKARLIINDRLDVAMAIGADGVHLGRDSFPPELARSILGPEKIIGRSIHSLSEFSPWEEKYLDYLIVSPIFKTASKPGARPVGLGLLKRLKGKTSLALYALGGIKAGNVHLLKEKACGVAVISAIINHKNPAGAARRIKRELMFFR